MRKKDPETFSRTEDNYWSSCAPIPCSTLRQNSQIIPPMTTPAVCAKKIRPQQHSASERHSSHVPASVQLLFSRAASSCNIPSPLRSFQQAHSFMIRKSGASMCHANQQIASALMCQSGGDIRSSKLRHQISLGHPCRAPDHQAPALTSTQRMRNASTPNRNNSPCTVRSWGKLVASP